MGGALRALRPGARAEVRVVDVDGGEDRLVLAADRMLEAPNWTRDGAALIVNGEGRLWRLPLDRPALEPIPVEGIADANNDHLLSPNGATLFLSADGAVHAVAATGGRPRRVSPDDGRRYYLHGVSPDGAVLACTTIDPAGGPERWGIDLLPSAGGGAARRLIGAAVPLDGPEWTPDGEWLWFNAEIGGARPGHARLFRVRAEGGEPERMTHGASVDWFPHPSPDGAHVAFLSYPPGTQGHPADLPVRVRLMPAAGGAARDLARLTGGQGTINVNSWSPDSRRLAYVAYPEERA